MVKLSIILPDDVKEIMDQHKEVHWEEMAKDYIWEYAKKLDLADKVSADSKLTCEDANLISAKIKEGLALKYKSK